MKDKDEELYAKYKYACALNKLLALNKRQHERNKKKGIEDLKLTHSYDTLSADTGLRGATISNILNGKSDTKISSIHIILKSMGFSHTKFGEIMDNLKDEEVKKFIEEKTKKRK
jgi:uncharacterized protein YerC